MIIPPLPLRLSQPRPLTYYTSRVLSPSSLDGHSSQPSNYTSNPIRDASVGDRRAASIVRAFAADLTFAAVSAIELTGLSIEGLLVRCFYG